MAYKLNDDLCELAVVVRIVSILSYSYCKAKVVEPVHVYCAHGSECGRPAFLQFYLCTYTHAPCMVFDFSYVCIRLIVSQLRRRHRRMFVRPSICTVPTTTTTKDQLVASANQQGGLAACMHVPAPRPESHKFRTPTGVARPCSACSFQILSVYIPNYKSF